MAVQAQEQPENDSPDYMFWSGTVTAVEESAVTVRRKLVGKKPEVRRFAMTAETKVDGTLKLNARVTVAFVETDEGIVARRILVRTK